MNSVNFWLWFYFKNVPCLHAICRYKIKSQVCRTIFHWKRQTNGKFLKRKIVVTIQYKWSLLSLEPLTRHIAQRKCWRKCLQKLNHLFLSCWLSTQRLNTVCYAKLLDIFQKKYRIFLSRFRPILSIETFFLFVFEINELKYHRFEFNLTFKMSTFFGGIISK